MDEVYLAEICRSSPFCWECILSRRIVSASLFLHLSPLPTKTMNVGCPSHSAFSLAIDVALFHQQVLTFSSNTTVAWESVNTSITLSVIGAQTFMLSPQTHAPMTRFVLPSSRIRAILDCLLRIKSYCGMCQRSQA